MFGGRSLEHDVSVVSGLQVLHALDPDECSAIPIYVDQTERWWTGDDIWKTETFAGAQPDTSRLTEVTLGGPYGQPLLLPLNTWRRTPTTKIDVFVPVLHGTFGEDGCLQGLLDLRGCAYVGSGVTASATGMNKRLTKIIAAERGVPIVPWLACERQVLDRFDLWMPTFVADVQRRFSWPVIVKPCNLGSSAGVSVAADHDELIAGILRVFEYDTEALVEPFIRNRLELNVSVAGLEQPVASATEMPVIQRGSPLSFSEKYKKRGRKSVGSSEGMAGALRVLDPEALPLALRHSAQELAVEVFETLGCEGIARADFLINTDTDELFFNEINTIPGSLSFYLWSAAPHFWTITELLSKLMDRAERLRATRLGLQREPPPELRLLGRL
jgi:D-alanine-D-alanine ligase